MKALIERIRNEPVLLVTLVTAVLSLLVTFHISLTQEQTGAIVTVVIAALGFVARSKVTPTRKVDEAPVSEDEPVA